MRMRPSFFMIAGALLTTAVAIASGAHGDGAFAAELSKRSEKAISASGGDGINARFSNRFGWPTRHPLLSGGESHSEETRDRVAKAVAGLPGVGGVSWSDGSMLAQSNAAPLSPLHCQEDVEALLTARSIRFEEASSTLDSASAALLDEVAAALRPCLGSVISIKGHTDSSGSEEINRALSKLRAEVVQQALIAKGIPAEGLNTEGLGSSEPVEGLQPGDPANRRIEFEVVATVPIEPTPIDTPGPR